MKNLYLYLWGAIVAMFTLNACTDEAHLPVSEENPQEESSLCTFTIPEVPVHGIDGSSRTAISIENDKLKFEWAVGDRIGILPDEGSQVYFTIDAQTAGGTSASFDGGAWALKANHQYDAYFPFVPDIMLDRTAVPVDYTNQKQTGNNSMAHLGAHDYLAAQGTTNGQGGVNYTFQRMGAVAILNFTVPNAGTELTSVTLKANEACFTTKGTINLDNEPLAITPSETAESITVGVDYTTTAANEKVTVYFMCYPDQLEGKNLNVEVNYEGSEEPLYFTTEGKYMEAGDGYVLNTQPIPYLTFSAASEQTMTMVSYRYTLDESIEYSVNGSEWTQVGKVSGDEASGITYTTITFGGNSGTLRMRGKSDTGMAANENDRAWITFGNSEVPVSCTGDIRTLVDYTNYRDASTSQARFSAMFSGCTPLVSAPELPATDLATKCYSFMFRGCTGLTTAPVLPAPVLAEGCYSSMFQGCSNLNSVTMLATDVSAEMCLDSWLNNVAATGTFYKNSSVTDTSGYGIPTGWTVTDYTESE